MPALTQREGSVHIYFLCDKEVLERECPPHLTPDYPPPPWEEVGLSDLMVIRPRSLLSGSGHAKSHCTHDACSLLSWHRVAPLVSLGQYSQQGLPLPRLPGLHSPSHPGLHGCVHPFTCHQLRLYSPGSWLINKRWIAGLRLTSSINDK